MTETGRSRTCDIHANPQAGCTTCAWAAEPRTWAILTLQRWGGVTQAADLHGCLECGAAIWDRRRHANVCPATPAAASPKPCTCGAESWAESGYDHNPSCPRAFAAARSQP